MKYPPGDICALGGKEGFEIGQILLLIIEKNPEGL